MWSRLLIGAARRLQDVSGAALGVEQAGLVATEGPATGATMLSDWLQEHATEVGRVYASELARHYR